MLQKIKNVNDDPKMKVDRINNAIISLINLSEITRFKNITLKKTFTEEFFKNIKHYISLD